MTESAKISKEAVLYIDRSNTQYQCRDCVFRKNGANKCALYGRSVSIKPLGGCGEFILFKHANLPDMPYWAPGIYTKENTGYVENEPGFTCGRCNEFLDDKEDCKKINKDSSGDDPGKITSGACCNRWEKLKTDEGNQ